jgi:hypothetical protein
MKGGDNVTIFTSLSVEEAKVLAMVLGYYTEIGCPRGRVDEVYDLIDLLISAHPFTKPLIFDVED